MSEQLNRAPKNWENKTEFNIACKLVKQLLKKFHQAIMSEIVIKVMETSKSTKTIKKRDL